MIEAEAAERLKSITVESKPTEVPVEFETCSKKGKKNLKTGQETFGETIRHSEPVCKSVQEQLSGLNFIGFFRTPSSGKA